MQVGEPAVLIFGCPPVQLALIPSTRPAAACGDSKNGAPAFTGDLLACQSGAASPLPSFAMRPAFPTSDYYDGSAPSRRHQRTPRLGPAGPTAGRFPRSLPFG
jgi:hypothetical protein